ncbi:hypothetical protein L204_104234 [Cryptococcus depauperatus]
MASIAPTVVWPYGYSLDTCGYCTPSGRRSNEKSSWKYGMIAKQLTPHFYQILIDRGWRRAGSYIYHPDMERTCCPQYTIRLDTQNFKSSKKQRQVVNRFNRFLETGFKPGESMGFEQGKSNQKKKGPPRNTIEDLHKFEVGTKEKHDVAHRFETELVPAQATQESFQLYKSYQISIHKDEPEDCNMESFDRFLCSNTFVITPIKYANAEAGKRGVKEGKLPRNYGAYHLHYRIDGKLVGISVLDIVPHGVSSVYFIWDPAWAWASLGKLSALYEVSLVKRLAEAGAGQGMRWAYLGYWVPSCKKMIYKSEYMPSFLLDPGTNEYHELTPSLESFLKAHPSGYFPFKDVKPEPNNPGPIEVVIKTSTLTKVSNMDSSAIGQDADEDEKESDWKSDSESELEGFPSPPPPSFADPSSFSEEEVDQVLVLPIMKRGILGRRQLYTVSELEFVASPFVRQTIRQFLAAMGKEWVACANDQLQGNVPKKAVIFIG